jgi:ferritin
MLSKKVEKLLNEQIEIESSSSYTYLAMASWCDINGMEGAASFFYKQSDEERIHMLKLFKYINEKGGHAITPINSKQRLQYKNIIEIMQAFHKHEQSVSDAVNKLVYVANTEKDYTTLNFLQWYVQEQHEEETMARSLLDKIKLIGTGANGLYLIDKEIGNHANKNKETSVSMGESEE